MNVDHESERFLEVVPWDSLSDTDKASGEWVRIDDMRAGKKLLSAFASLLGERTEMDALRQKILDAEKRLLDAARVAPGTESNDAND